MQTECLTVRDTESRVVQHPNYKEDYIEYIDNQVTNEILRIIANEGIIDGGKQTLEI